MVDLGSEAGVLKLSSTAAGAVAAVVLFAPDKFQDSFYDAVRLHRAWYQRHAQQIKQHTARVCSCKACGECVVTANVCSQADTCLRSRLTRSASPPAGSSPVVPACTGPLQSVPRASVSVTRHHAIVLAGLSALMAAVASPRADRAVQRTALKAAGATWLAAGLLNVYETGDGQTVGAPCNGCGNGQPCCEPHCLQEGGTEWRPHFPRCPRPADATTITPNPSRRPRPPGALLPSTACWEGCACGRRLAATKEAAGPERRRHCTLAWVSLAAALLTEHKQPSSCCSACIDW